MNKNNTSIFKNYRTSSSSGYSSGVYYSVNKTTKSLNNFKQQQPLYEEIEEFHSPKKLPLVVATKQQKSKKLPIKRVAFKMPPNLSTTETTSTKIAQQQKQLGNESK